MSTDTLTRKEIAEQSFDCCIQLVKSFGGNIANSHRSALIECMEHFKSLSLRDIGRERTVG